MNSPDPDVVVADWWTKAKNGEFEPGPRTLAHREEIQKSNKTSTAVPFVGTVQSVGNATSSLHRSSNSTQGPSNAGLGDGNRETGPSHNRARNLSIIDIAQNQQKPGRWPILDDWLNMEQGANLQLILQKLGQSMDEHMKAPYRWREVSHKLDWKALIDRLISIKNIQNVPLRAISGEKDWDELTSELLAIPVFLVVELKEGLPSSALYAGSREICIAHLTQRLRLILFQNHLGGDFKDILKDESKNFDALRKSIKSHQWDTKSEFSVRSGRPMSRNNFLTYIASHQTFMLEDTFQKFLRLSLPPLIKILHRMHQMELKEGTSSTDSKEKAVSQGERTSVQSSSAAKTIHSTRNH